MIKILSSHCSTKYGPHIFDNLRGDPPETQPEYTLLDQIKLWMDQYPGSDQIICTPGLVAGVELLCDITITALFPESFDALCEQITHTPTWFLAGSPVNNSLVGCAMVRSDQGFKMVETDLDAVIMTESQILPEVPYVFDLSALPHSQEQAWLLALMGADHLMQSPLFRCKKVGRMGESARVQA